MESIKGILNKKKKRHGPDRCRYPWQDLAKEVIEAISDVDEFKKQSSVFAVCKRNESAARAAFTDCKELSKLHVMYFLKVFSEISKKQND